jgi:hypothetical protein
MVSPSHLACDSFGVIFLLRCEIEVVVQVTPP